MGTTVNFDYPHAGRYRDYVIGTMAPENRTRKQGAFSGAVFKGIG